jgi:proteasome-associated ATPase
MFLLQKCTHQAKTGKEKKTMSSDSKQNEPNGEFDEATLRKMLAGGTESALQAGEYLLKQNAGHRVAIHEMRRVHNQMQREAAAICEPANLMGVVTEVERNGQLRAAVHFDGLPAVRANIHPSLNPETVTIGAGVYVTGDRGCVLGFSNHCPWKHVGTFEEHIEDRKRALVRYQEHVVPVKLVNGLADKPLVRGDRIGFNLEAGMAFVQLAEPDSSHLFTDDLPDDDFSQLAGLDSQIRLIKRVVGFHLQYPHTAKRFRLSGKRGILLLGPPGNAKTRLARCVAKHLEKLFPGKPCRFQSVCGSEDYSQWLGGTERQLKKRFDAARRAAKDGRVVLFFDEIDSLAKMRGTDHGSSAPDRILGTFLGMMADVQKSLDDNVLVIAATNRASLLDPGVTRPGRLDYKITIPPPNRRAAEAILKCYLAGYPLAGSLDELLAPLVHRLFSPSGPYAGLVAVRLSDGRRITVHGRELISGAILESVVLRAAEAAAYREPDTKIMEAITADDLAASLDGELLGLVGLLSPANVKAYITSVPQDAHAVEVLSQSSFGSAYVRATH